MKEPVKRTNAQIAAATAIYSDNYRPAVWNGAPVSVRRRHPEIVALGVHRCGSTRLHDLDQEAGRRMLAHPGDPCDGCGEIAEHTRVLGPLLVAV